VDWAIILDMNHADKVNESPANSLCKSCGLCCTGHLFEWTKLRSSELNSIQSLGLKVFHEPHQRGFSQPCPLWDGVCTIYESPSYPRFCHTYKCRLLKELLEENISLPSALKVVRGTMDMIHELETFLPDSSEISFRGRLIAHLESGNAKPEIQQKAKKLLNVFDKQFGVNDFFDK
jgi:hypothetical protein